MTTASICNELQVDEQFSESERALLNQQFISVVCNGMPGVLNRYRLGSGGKGKCIEFEGDMLTPNEFQNRCGKASSKDWKRSIHYRGRPLYRLIDRKILICHAISCICAACTNNCKSQNPIRYFEKSIRKRKTRDLSNNINGDGITAQLPVSTCPQNRLPNYPPSRSLTSKCGQQFNQESKKVYSVERQPPLMTGQGCTRMVVVDYHKKPECSEKKGDDSSNMLIVKSNPVIEKAHTINKVFTDDLETDLLPMVISNKRENPIPSINPISDLHDEVLNGMANERKCWSHLESVVETLIRDTVSLRAIVSQTKEASMLAKANMLIQLRRILSTTHKPNTPTSSQCFCDEHPIQSHHQTFSGSTQHSSCAQLEKLPNQLLHTTGIVRYVSNMLNRLKGNENQGDQIKPSTPMTNDTTIWPTSDKYLATSRINRTIVTDLQALSHLQTSQINNTSVTLSSCNSLLFSRPVLGPVVSLMPLTALPDHVESATKIAFNLDQPLCTLSAEPFHSTSPATTVSTDLSENPHLTTSNFSNKKILELTSALSGIQNPDKILNLSDTRLHSEPSNICVERPFDDRLAANSIYNPTPNISGESATYPTNQIAFPHNVRPLQTWIDERTSDRSGDTTNSSNNCFCDDPQIADSPLLIEDALFFERRSSSDPTSISTKWGRWEKSEIGSQLDKHIDGQYSAKTKSAKTKDRNLRLLQLCDIPRKRTESEINHRSYEGYVVNNATAFNTYIRNKIRRVQIDGDIENANLEV